MDEDSTKPRNLGGRPPHVPTDATRNLVVAMIGVGAQPHEVAHEISLARSKMYVHYAEEIKTGKRRLINRIALGVVQRALAGDNACSFFFLKTQAAWVERQVHDVTIRGTIAAANDATLLAIALGGSNDAAAQEEVPNGPDDVVH